MTVDDILGAGFMEGSDADGDEAEVRLPLHLIERFVMFFSGYGRLRR